MIYEFLSVGLVGVIVGMILAAVFVDKLNDNNHGDKEYKE